MRKSQSTKIAEPIPVEFEQVFIHHGWDRANRVFGKRATTRYYTALGAERLRAERNTYLDQRKTAPIGQCNQIAPISAHQGVRA